MQDIKSKAQSFKNLESKVRKELQSDLSKKLAKNYKDNGHTGAKD